MRETEPEKIVRLKRKVKAQRSELRNLNRAIAVARKMERSWFLDRQYWKREADDKSAKIKALRELLHDARTPWWRRFYEFITDPSRGTDEGGRDG